MSKLVSPCWSCMNRRTISGDCHIGCAKPPKIEVHIGSGGDDRYSKAKEIAEKDKAVVRCIWPRCGIFPLAFDANTVFGCSNFQEGRVEEGDMKNILAAWAYQRYGKGV